MNIAPRRMTGDAVRAPTRSPVWEVKRASMAQLSVIFDPVDGAPGRYLSCVAEIASVTWPRNGGARRPQRRNGGIGNGGRSGIYSIGRTRRERT